MNTFVYKLLTYLKIVKFLMFEFLKHANNVIHVSKTKNSVSYMLSIMVKLVLG